MLVRKAGGVTATDTFSCFSLNVNPLTTDLGSKMRNRCWLSKLSAVWMGCFIIRVQTDCASDLKAGLIFVWHIHRAAVNMSLAVTLAQR